MFKLGLIQMRVLGGQKQENLRHAEDLIRHAAAAGAEVLVLPEALTLGSTDSSAKLEADEIPGGESCFRFQQAARENGVFVCAGLVERHGAKIFNAAVLIDPEVNVLFHHRKLN